VEVLVPKRWRLSLLGTPVFGGFDDRTRSDEFLPADAPLLKVRGLAVFGGVVVANESTKAARREARDR
jgi:hypothetical protein